MSNVINYDLIYNELTKPVYDTKELIRAHGFFSTEAILRELRTVWLGTPRQTGSTKWMVSKVKENPKAIVIARDSDFATFIRSVGEGAIDDQVYPVSIIANDPDAQGIDFSFDTVFVDDASHTLTGELKAAFYSWIARNSSSDTRIVMIA